MVAKLVACMMLALIKQVLATDRTFKTIQPSLSEIEAAAETAITAHTTSNVTGKAFDRFVIIWLENTNYDKAYDNDDMQWLAQYGIVLTNNWALSHPSQENYLGSVAGDYFGLDNDDFTRVPSNVSNVADLLDSKNISWAEYQEDIPYTGYQGYEFKNQETGANDYVRKHNPFVLFDNVADNDTRLANIKSFNDFYLDLNNDALPQWMFITPNMTDDGHDSTIDVASTWTRDFLTPLLNNTNFMQNTLLLVTFDETETYTIPNRIWGLLLGDAIPESLQGTEDDTYYDHYSQISSIEDNWDLPHLGRLDVNANVYQLVSNVSGWSNKDIDTSSLYNNKAKTGYFNDVHQVLPAPNCDVVNQAGNSILPAVESVWSASCHGSSNYYTASFSTTTTTAA